MPKQEVTETYCHCRHKWDSHSKHRFGTVARKNGHGWCIICMKWCNIKEFPNVYKSLKI